MTARTGEDGAEGGGVGEEVRVVRRRSRALGGERPPGARAPAGRSLDNGPASELWGAVDGVW